MTVLSEKFEFTFVDHEIDFFDELMVPSQSVEVCPISLTFTKF